MESRRKKVPNYINREYAPFLDVTGKELSGNVGRIADWMCKPSRLDAEYSALITKENIDNKFVEWWGLADTGEFTRTQLLERWFNLLRDDKIYGVKTSLYSHSASPVGKLTDDSIPLGICTPSTETVRGTDNFCKEKAFWTVEVNYEIGTDGEIEIKAVDNIHEEYSRDGGPGMVGVAQKSAYYYVSDDGTHNILKYSLKKHTHFKLLPEARSLPKNKKRPFVVHAKYMGGIGKDGLPTSASGLAAMIYTYSHNSQISIWRKRGANYSGISSVDVKFREMMFRLKYARKGNSDIMSGCCNYYYTYRPAIAETDVNRVILNVANANNLVVGSWVNVGTTERGYGNVLNNVRIKSIKPITIEGQEYRAVYLDTETLISPTVEWYIATIPWGSGSCDNVLGVDGSPNNTNGKYPFIIQGLESQIGAYVVLADVIASNVYENGIDTLTPKICRQAKNIASSPNGNYYDALSYSVKQEKVQWHYIQDIIDENEVITPKTLDGGAGSTTGYQCGVYINAESAYREWLVWALLYDGSMCGLACSAVSNGLGSSYWTIAAGAPGSGATRGEWAE